MSGIPFVKMQGLGNDYVYLDVVAGDAPPDAPELARRISDRRTGVGGDGLILVAPSEQADVRMIMYNADGSRAEMCGNGLRCVASLAHHAGHAPAEMTIETDAGLLWARVEGPLPAAQVTTDLGPPRLAAAEIPLAADAPASAGDGGLLDLPRSVDGHDVLLHCLSMGNPHAVCFVPSTAEAPVQTLGPRLERDPAFPQRANIEFVEVLARDRVRQRTWERGSGETHACGTGAAAVAVAACLRRGCARELTVELLGGPLAIRWREDDDHLIVTGPAVAVFSGRYPIA